MWPKNKPYSQESRDKISRALRGHPVSLETRDKIRESLKGRRLGPLDSEHRQKISESLKGTRNPMWKGGRGKTGTWKGGRGKTGTGYIRILQPNHPKADHGGYVNEHLIVWEKAHGKALPEGWVIHHINGIRDDNRQENLVALPLKSHHNALLIHQLRKRIRELEIEVRHFKAERKLQWL